MSINKISKLGKRKKQCKRFWLRKTYEKREQLGSFYTLFLDLKEDQKCFLRYFCKTPDRFEQLLEFVGLKIKKKNTRLRRASPTRERLVITLRYVGSSETQK